MDETLFRLMLLVSDQISDIQRNKKTIKGYEQLIVAYNHILKIITTLRTNPDTKFVPYNGRFFTEEQIDKMFYRKEF